jgi:hypothetical protein
MRRWPKRKIIALRYNTPTGYAARVTRRNKKEHHTSTLRVECDGHVQSIGHKNMSNTFVEVGAFY